VLEVHTCTGKEVTGQCEFIFCISVFTRLSCIIHSPGGSYFWVREILQFIKEHGAEHFLAALGETDNTTATASSSFDMPGISSLISPRSSATASNSNHGSIHGSVRGSVHGSVHSSSGSAHHGSVRNSVHSVHSVHNGGTSVHSVHVARGSSFSRTNSNKKSRPNSANGSSTVPGKLVSFTEPSSGAGGGITNADGGAVTPSQKQLGERCDVAIVASNTL